MQSSVVHKDTAMVAVRSNFAKDLSMAMPSVAADVAERMSTGSGGQPSGMRSSYRTTVLIEPKGVRYSTNVLSPSTRTTRSTFSSTVR